MLMGARASTSIGLMSLVPVSPAMSFARLCPATHSQSLTHGPSPSTATTCAPMTERPCVHPTPPWISCRRPASRFTIWSSLLTNGHKTRCGTARSRCFWDWSRRRESASTARSPRGCRYRFLLCRRRLFTTATSLSCVLPMAPMRLCNSKTTFRLRARNAG